MTTKYQPNLRVSEYVLEECVGAGTFGEVWRARHHVWDKERVAIKLPTEPQYVRYLQREGLVVHGLRHPNIVRVLGMDPYADTPYLVMELVNGPSLRAVVGEHPDGVPIPVAVTVLRGLLAGLSAAHAAGVLHRDLKPGNVLLNLDGRPLVELTPALVKLGDFGFGKDNGEALRSIAQSASLARDDQLVGTLAYMAPELREGGRAADARSDLYAVGVMLFEMLTGERPAGAELPSTVRAESPARLDDIFRKLYAHYERRYGSAGDVIRDLEPLDASGAVRRNGPPPIPGVRTPDDGPPPPPSSPYANGGFCVACRRPAEPHDQFCTHCGQQLIGRIRRCRACGGYPGPNDVHCIFCGVELSGAEV